MSETAKVQLPRWQSHKKVWADKIIGVTDETGVWLLAGGGSVETSDGLKGRVNAPTPIGGYYVQYDDGYESWSPAKAFEEGYTLVEA